MTYGFYSFQPLDTLSVYKGFSYVLPPITGDDQRVLSINRTGAALVELEEYDGAFPTSGSKPLFISYTEVNITFDIIPTWLNIDPNYPTDASGIKNPVRTAKLGGNPAGIDAAIHEFVQVLVESGEGTLTEIYMTSPTATASRTTSAWLNGQVTITRYAGGTRAAIGTTIVVPSARWNISGTKTTFF